MEADIRLLEGLLDNVFGIFVESDVAEHKAVDSSMVPLEKNSKGLILSTFRRCNENFLGGCSLPGKTIRYWLFELTKKSR